MDNLEQNPMTNSEPEEEKERLSKSDLAKMLSGEMETPAKNKRLLAGILAGALVGLVEGGLPKTTEDYYRSAVYISIRILTGIACALVPWRVHAIFRGIVFGLVAGIPFYLTYGRTDLLRSLFLALIAGLLIGYWTERFGIPRRINHTSGSNQ